MGHPQGRPAWQTAGLLVVVLAGWLGYANTATARSRTPSDPTLAAARQRNETLLGAATPLQDVVRFAQRRDTKKVDGSIAALQAQVPRLLQALKPGARRQFEARLRDLHRARRRADLAATAMAAVEAYRTLILSLDASVLTIPVQVDELGYASLKAELLVDSPAPHWTDLAQVARDALSNWERIRVSVHNDALRQLMQLALTSLNEAANSKDRPMARCAAQFTGAAVELLRRQYPLWRR